METKKLKLFKQYLFNAFIFLMLLIIVIVDRGESIPQGYQKIITRAGYMGMLLIGFSGLLKQEKVDESAEKILGKVNRITMELIGIGLLLLAITIGAPAFQKLDMTRDNITILILLLLFITKLVKAILFLYYDRKGL